MLVLGIKIITNHYFTIQNQLPAAGFFKFKQLIGGIMHALEVIIWRNRHPRGFIIGGIVNCGNQNRHLLRHKSTPPKIITPQKTKNSPSQLS